MRLAFQVGVVTAILLTAQQFLLVNVLLSPTTSSSDERSITAVHEVSPVVSISNEEPVARILTKSEWVENLTHGVRARAFDYAVDNLPCFAPEDKKHYNRPVTPTSVRKGFMFMKLMKTGGSTAAGINIRIMRQAAKQLRARERTEFQYCQGRFEHAWGYDMLANRERNGSSFTWTIVRDPTKRAVSQFFHFEVSRKNTSATDSLFQKYLWGERNILSNYYLQVLSTERTVIFDSQAPALINKLLYEYDFIGVTERMDETAVALMMLLNVDMGSILYLNAKGNGGYDDGGFMGQCFYIEPSHISRGMQKFFEHPQWKAAVKWDELLYRAANRSLDLTIDRLGRASFEKNLTKFRNAQAVAHERCLPREVFPCTSTGIKNRNKSCLWKDSGCGSDCLDEVATELGLW
jgi:Sulfotransferase family